MVKHSTSNKHQNKKLEQTTLVLNLLESDCVFAQVFDYYV